MKQESLNHELKAVCCNGALCTFDFHGDNAALATDHVQQLANGDLKLFDFDMKPDKLHHITYRRKTATKWKIVFPNQNKTN